MGVDPGAGLAWGLTAQRKERLVLISTDTSWPVGPRPSYHRMGWAAGTDVLLSL